MIFRTHNFDIVWSLNLKFVFFTLFALFSFLLIYILFNDNNLQLLELDPKNRKSEFLKEFPPIATKYILANFFCTWKTEEFSVIKSMLHRITMPITNEQTVCGTI